MHENVFGLFYGVPWNEAMFLCESCIKNSNRCQSKPFNWAFVNSSVDFLYLPVVDQATGGWKWDKIHQSYSLFW